MIDESAIRTALEAVLGESFAGLPVSRVGESNDPSGPHIRTYMIREPRNELYRGIRRASGIFGVLVHVGVNDGIAQAESIAKQIPALYRPNEIDNATITAEDGTTITIREISLMSPYRGADEAEGEARWLISPVQIDWRVDIT